MDSADYRIEVSASEVLVYGKKDEVVVQEVRVGKGRGIDRWRADSSPVYGGNSLVLETKMGAGNVVQEYREYPRADGVGEIAMQKCNARKAAQMITQKQKILAASCGDGLDIGMHSQPSGHAGHFLIDQ